MTFVSAFILNLEVFAPHSFASVANFVKVIVCWKGSYQKLSKQDIIFYFILQLLKMADLSIMVNLSIIFLEISQN